MKEGADKPQAVVSARRFWLDWLRVLAMGVIFLFHCQRPFDIFPPWHVMNPARNLGFTLFQIFVSGWIMPLFFVISGIAVYSSLAKRSASQFVKDRLARLMIPFLSVGLLVILPVNVYYDAVFHGHFAGSFASFYLGPYFTKFFPFDFNFSPSYLADSNQGIYLWYLFWLFVFCLITVHLFKWLATGQNRNMLSKLHAACNARGGIVLLAIPPIIVNIAAVPPYFVFAAGYGGWKLPAYLVLFVTGFVMASSPRFEESIEKSRTTALSLGILTSFLIMVAIIRGGMAQAPAMPQPAAMVGDWRLYVAVSAIWAFNGWCWVAAILGFGRQYLSFDHPSLKVSSELVLPFYVLHQSVIVATAFYAVRLDLSVMEKYLLIVLASFSIVAALLYPISKINWLRFLFGMKCRKPGLLP